MKHFGDPKLNVLIVAAAHNEYLPDPVVFGQYMPNGRGDAMNDFPAQWGDPSNGDYLPNLLVVSATDINTQISPLNPYANWASFAPGAGISLPVGKSGDTIVRGQNGASFCELRPSPWVL
jgi:hypothetical protein